MGDLGHPRHRAGRPQRGGVGPDPWHRRAGRAHRLAHRDVRGGVGARLPGQSDRQLRAGRPRRRSRHLRDPPGRQGRSRRRARLDDGHPVPRGDRGGPGRGHPPRLHRRTHLHQPVLPRAPPRPDRRDDRHRAAADGPRAVHAELVRVQERRSAAAEPALRRQGRGRRRLLQRQRPHGVHHRAPGARRAGPVHPLHEDRDRDSSRRGAVRPGGHPRCAGGTDPDDRVGDHRRARLHHGLPPGGRLQLPDRQRARRSRCWSAPWRPWCWAAWTTSPASRPPRSGWGSSSRRSCSTPGETSTCSRCSS